MIEKFVRGMIMDTTAHFPEEEGRGTSCTTTNTKINRHDNFLSVIREDD